MPNKSIDTATHKHIPIQLDGETELEYIWFTIYCMQGIGRSISSVADLGHEKESTGDNADTSNDLYNKIKAASITFNWVDRAQQYDMNQWAKHIDKLSDAYASEESEWKQKCEDTKKIIKKTITAALEIQKTNDLILGVITRNSEEYQDNMLAILKLKKALAETAATTIKVQEILTRAWQIKEHTDTIKTAEGWQRQSLEFLYNSK